MNCGKRSRTYELIDLDENSDILLTRISELMERLDKYLRTMNLVYSYEE